MGVQGGTAAPAAPAAAAAAAAAAAFAGRRAQQQQPTWGSAVVSALRSERAAVSFCQSPCYSSPCRWTQKQQAVFTAAGVWCLALCPPAPMQWAVQNAVGALFAAVFAVVADLQFALACLVGVLYRQAGFRSQQQQCDAMLCAMPPCMRLPANQPQPDCSTPHRAPIDAAPHPWCSPSTAPWAAACLAALCLLEQWALAAPWVSCRGMAPRHPALRLPGPPHCA